MASSPRKRSGAKSTKALERKRQIAEAVIEIADSYGVHGVTMAKIAARVGISEPALYIYFAGRDMILCEAVDVMYEQNIASMADWSDSRDVVEHFLRMSSTSGVRSPTLQRAMRIKLQLLASPPVVGLQERMILGEVKQFEAHVRMVEEGKAEGSIREDVNSRRLVWDLYHAYAAEGMPAHLLGLEDDTRSVRESPIVVLLKSVATDPSRLEEYLDRLEAERRGQQS